MSRNINELHPELQSKISKLIDKCADKGLKIGIGECVRTVAEQDALYAKGRTAPGGIVTNAKGSTYSSMHQWGIAFDFYRNDGKGAYCTDGSFFEKVGEIGQDIGLEWGGSWKSIKDRPHFQLPQWGSTPSKLKTQYVTPDKFRKQWNAKYVSNNTTTKITLYTVKDMPNATKTDGWVLDLQHAIGSTEDGKYGKNTLAKCPKVVYGDRGEVVKLLQKRLNTLGYKCGTPDGKYGNGTKKGVVSYERHLGFKDSTGAVDKAGKTWSALLIGIK